MTNATDQINALENEIEKIREETRLYQIETIAVKSDMLELTREELNGTLGKDLFLPELFCYSSISDIKQGQLNNEILELEKQYEELYHQNQNIEYIVSL